MANYFIIGDDGKEYGPVSEAELQSWINENRAGAQTKVRPDTATEWRPLAEVPELAALLKKPGSPPPPISAPAAKPTTGKTSALAIASLVLGIIGIFTCGLGSIVGLVLGIIALVKISKSNGELRGKGQALAGVIVSGAFFLLIPIFAAMLLPALAAAKQKAQQISCVNNEKQLAIAVMIYSGDHTNQLPAAASWCDAIKESVGSDKVFKCPSASESSTCDYAFNDRLGGLDQSQINPQTVMIFESDGGWNAHGGPASVASNRHHRNITVVAFADGHVEIVPVARLPLLRWNP